MCSSRWSETGSAGWHAQCSWRTSRLGLEPASRWFDEARPRQLQSGIDHYQSRKRQKQRSAKNNNSEKTLSHFGKAGGEVVHSDVLDDTMFVVGWLLRSAAVI